MNMGRLTRRLSIATIASALIVSAGIGPAAGPGGVAAGGSAAAAPAVTDAGRARAEEPRVRPTTRAALRARYPYVAPKPPVKPAPKPPVKPAPKPPATVAPPICLTRAAIICASKRERTLRYYQRGRLRVVTPVAFGRPGYETPSGLWTVKIKDANAWSYEYKAPLPFSLEYDLVRGIYIHYSSTFARIGRTYIGSHGCINIGDYATASRLFRLVPVGGLVYVY